MRVYIYISKKSKVTSSAAKSSNKSRFGLCGYNGNHLTKKGRRSLTSSSQEVASSKLQVRDVLSRAASTNDDEAVSSSSQRRRAKPVARNDFLDLQST